LEEWVSMKDNLYLLQSVESYCQYVAGGSDDDFLFHVREVRTPGASERPPCRPLPPKSPGDLACRTTTPSSGHFSAGSKASSPSPPGRRELDGLRRRLSQELREWGEEREGLLAELARCRGPADRQVSLLEDKVREVLAMVRSLSTMDISDAALGRMVVEAVEAAYDPAAGEVAVFRFLALLYRSTREHERRAAGSLLARAMQAVGEDPLEASDSSASSLGAGMPEGMRTLRPRRPRDTLRDMDVFEF
jgi:hypothetical protein